LRFAVFAISSPSENRVSHSAICRCPIGGFEVSNLKVDGEELSRRKILNDTGCAIITDLDIRRISVRQIVTFDGPGQSRAASQGPAELYTLAQRGQTRVSLTVTC
jgi:hypothetical protein